MHLNRTQIIALLHYLGRVNPRGYNDETELIKLIKVLEGLFAYTPKDSGGVKSSSKLHGFQPEVVQSR